MLSLYHLLGLLIDIAKGEPTRLHGRMSTHATFSRPTPAMDESKLEIRGPWLELALLGMERYPSGESLKFGSANADRFIPFGHGRAPSMGGTLIIFRAHSPMGPPLGSIQLISEQRPELAFMLDYVDGNSGELESHFFLAGQSQSRFEASPSDWDQTLAGLEPRWAQLDRACMCWILDAQPPEFNCALPTTGPCEPYSRQIATWLAGGATIMEQPWTWPCEMPDPWLATASPWTPAPPWDPTRKDLSARALAAMSRQDGIDPLARLGAAKRLLSLGLAHQAQSKATLEQASSFPAFAMGPAERFRALAASERAPLNKALANASASANALFGQAFARMGISTCEAWSAQEIIDAALQNPAGMQALLRAPSWGFSDEDLGLVAMGAPPEVASLAEQELLSRGSQGESSQGKNSGRRI